MTLQECEEIVKVICKKFEVTPCDIIVRKGRGCKYHPNTKTILLQDIPKPHPFHCENRTNGLLHELAHHITYCNFPHIRRPHGKEFFSFLVEVVKAHYGAANMDKYPWGGEYKGVLYRYVQMVWREQHRDESKAARQATLEESKIVKEALRKAGIPVRKVRHDKGRLCIFLNCESRNERQELRLKAVQIAEELAGSGNDWIYVYETNQK